MYEHTIFYKYGKDIPDDNRITVDECINIIYDNHDTLDPSVHLLKEDDDGPTEYKLKIIDHSHERIEHLTTQMNCRIHNGSGEGHYMLGYEDSGENVGIGKEDIYKSLSTYI